MRVIVLWVLILAASESRLATATAPAIPMQTQTAPAPEVTLRLSSDTILLGEPVWVLVTARNTSNSALRWNPGDHCLINAMVTVNVVAPATSTPVACPYIGTLGSCGGTGSNTTVLSAGASATWRYLPPADFNVERVGTYELRLTSNPRRPMPGSTSTCVRTRVVPCFIQSSSVRAAL